MLILPPYVCLEDAYIWHESYDCKPFEFPTILPKPNTSLLLWQTFFKATVWVFNTNQVYYVWCNFNQVTRVGLQ